VNDASRFVDRSLRLIFHKHSNHPPMKLYVILDDQSNRSLGRKILFDTFDPEANCNSYRLIKCVEKNFSAERTIALIVQYYVKFHRRLVSMFVKYFR
jgi:hypothetical protein